MLESILVKRNSIEKQVVKLSENDGFATPRKHTTKLIGPMISKEKIMGGNKIKYVPIILEAKLRPMSQFSIKVYVGNETQNNHLMMMGHHQNTFFRLCPKLSPMVI
jgi:hypothetical protein